MLGGEVSKRFGAAGLPDDTIAAEFHGSRRAKFRGVAAQTVSV